MAVTYRWLCALRKFQRPRWGGAANTADEYLDYVAGQMLAYARHISKVDQMTDAEAEDYWRTASAAGANGGRRVMTPSEPRVGGHVPARVEPQNTPATAAGGGVDDHDGSTPT